MAADLLGGLSVPDLALIAVAGLTAVLVAQGVLSVSARVLLTGGVARVGWLVCGSLALGAGIWSMLLAASLVQRPPGPETYPLALAVLSGGLAFFGIFAALLGIAGRPDRWGAIGAGAVAGIVFTTIHLLMAVALGASLSLPRDGPFAAGIIGASALVWSALFAMAVRCHGGPGPGCWLRRIGSWAILPALLAGAGALSPSRPGPLAGAPPEPTGRHLVLAAPEFALAFSVAVMGLLIATIAAAGIDRRIRHRRAETEALRRSEDRFRSLVQASAQIVWTTAPDGHMLGDQASWAEFTGQSASSYTGWGWFNAIHPEDRERTARVWEETLANRTSAELEHRVRRHDGHFRDCVARLVPVLERNGTVREWVGTHTDVTERSRLQQERDLLAEAGRVLSSSLDDRETLGEFARLLVPRLAEWGALDLQSEDGSLRRLIGIHRDPGRSSLLREIGPHLRGGLGSVSASGPAPETESRLVRSLPAEALREIAPDAEYARRLAELGGQSLIQVPLTARGQILGILTLAAPVDGEPYDLRDLAFAEELARRAAVAIDNARLYSTARSAVRARDEVLGIVSHDLRNPIGAVATASDLLLALDPPADERRRHLHIIRRSARAANSLINDLLDVMQSDNGELAMDLRPSDPVQIVREACELMLPLARARGHGLTCRAPETLPTIDADPARLQQVLSNLIGNAIKFVPDGGCIEVLADVCDDGVRFSVADDGPGIDPDDLPRLFDRHWRARKTAHLGAGLGLAISRGIVHAHGGRIWAESEPGAGTTIHLILPIARETRGAPPVDPATTTNTPSAVPRQTPV